MAVFYIKMTILNDFPLDDEPVSRTGQFKQSLDSFYVTDSHLNDTNIAQMALFNLNLPVLMIFPKRKCQLVSLNKVLTVSMFHIVL